MHLWLGHQSAEEKVCYFLFLSVMLLFSVSSQRDNPRALNLWDSETPALSTCSNADIFRRMNTMLGNSLDLTGVCTTPSAKTKRDSLIGNLLALYKTCMEGVNCSLE